MLSPNYPKGGRLEFQHKMRLTGQSGHPEAVIIGVTNLLPSSVMPSFPIGSTGTNTVNVYR
jgi:hypothetical protein